MKSPLLLLTCIMTTVAAYAQKRTLQGAIADSSSKQPLQGATISILNKSDSSIIAYTVTDKKGEFECKNVTGAALLLSISYQGYKAVIKDIEENLKTIPTIYLVTSSDVLDEVIVSAPPVRIKNDTIEFSSSMLKTPPNAIAEDMLKKVPGIQVDKDGNVKAHGKEVQKIYVDGKEFFGNDPKMATKNLTADMIESVQIFDDKSDKAKFTKVDDGTRIKSINIKLKKGKNKGVFGRLFTGAGISPETNDFRYDANMMMHKFGGETRLSFTGSANNLNMQNFGGAGRGGRGMEMMVLGASPMMAGGAGSGITESVSAGINYNDKWKDIGEAGGSYLFSNTDNHSEQTVRRNTNLSTESANDSAALQNASTISDNRSKNHQMNGNVNIDIDSMTRLTYNANISVQSNRSFTRRLDSVFRFSPAGAKDYLSNVFNSSNSSEGSGYNLGNNVMVMRRFKKNGRSLMFGVNSMISNNSSETRTYAPVRSYDITGKLIQDSLQDFISDAKSKNTMVSVNTSYREPIGKNTFVEANYTFSRSNTSSDKKAYDFDSITGKYGAVNRAQTNYFQNENIRHHGGANIGFKQGKLEVQAGAGAEYSTLNNRTVRPLTFRDTTIEQHFLNFQPMASLTWEMSSNKYLRMGYNGSTNQPSLTQLQDAPDFTDQFSVTNGNPFLKQEFNSSMQLNYTSFNVANMSFFVAGISFSNTSNKIVNNADTLPARYKEFNGTPGVQYIVPVNLNGSFSGNTNISWGIPLKGKWKGSNVNFSNNIAYSRNAGILNSNVYYNNTIAVMQSASISLNIKDFNIGLGANFTYNKVSYSGKINNAGQKYFNQAYSAEFSYLFLKRFNYTTSFDCMINSGLGEGFNQAIPLWNSGIGMHVFKNRKGELRCSVNDLLNQNQAINRSVADNYIQDTKTMVLRRYFMLTFTYNIMRAGL